MPAAPLTVDCPNCKDGLVARPVVTLAEGDHTRRYLDNMPYAGQETCSRCGGSGKVPLDLSKVPE